MYDLDGGGILAVELVWQCNLMPITMACIVVAPSFVSKWHSHVFPTEKGVNQQHTPNPASKKEQKIRSLAKQADLIAHKSRKDGMWYFANAHNILISPTSGLREDEAMAFLRENEAV